MGMQPKIKQATPFIVKTCSICGGTFGPEGFIKTKSLFYPDGYLPMCADCIKQLLIEHNFDWDLVDKLCRYTDIPFIPAEFERLHESNGDNVFQVYADVFLSSEFEGLGWKQYYEEFLRLKEKGHIEDELPILKEEKRKQLKEKWGSNYDDEELQYLENLLDGLLQTQNISGALQFDQALKICKISLNLDSKIREGADFDKLMGSYDKLVKTAEFTPKNVKNASDFESTGELIKWLEKRGFKSKFYDNVTRDIVDETIKNIQSYNQRLYINESGIGDEITRRIEALKTIKDLENYYDVGKEYDLDEFENDGYEELMKNEEFVADVSGDNDE
ncbi:MAG: hypothetical protein PUJ51_09335 [Clostridiales bacterium]|uniref:hypothetical protein n=1 Tax=Terrisporobacter sp. TaxID=1965305 RepID=UPI002A4EB37A|nr:hypothetical protein [Terrisporobacter sp.]MDD7754697.1 hypothetical protein [Clostridiales bacterium]MDY4134078.1 hypothetical protein [Terrisporobacter sp.]